MYIYQKLESSRDYIIECYKGGISTNKLGKEFDCNPGSIYHFLSSCGVEIKKRSENYGKIAEYKDIIINKHSQGLSAYRIARDIGFSKPVVLKYAKQIGLDFSSKNKLTNPIRMKDQEELIRKLYKDGISGNQIAKQLGYAPSQITQFLNRLGYNLNKYTYETDLHFFDHIDTEVKAYILGFWYADGNVVDDKIRLSITDLDILERIKQEMKYTGEFYIRYPKKPNHKIQYCLSIARRELVDSLIRCGCNKNKTFTISFPAKDIVPQELIKDFIRGYIDGDGNIYVNKKANTIRCQIVGTRELLQGIESYCKTLNVNCSWSKRRKDSKNNYNVTIGGNVQCIRFLDNIYNQSSIHLPRKYNKFSAFRCIYSQLV